MPEVVGRLLSCFCALSGVVWWRFAWSWFVGLVPLIWWGRGVGEKRPGTL